MDKHLLGSKYKHLALPYSPTVGVFTPTPKMTHRDRLKEGSLVFHRLHFDGKTNAYYNTNKNTILERTAEGGGVSQSGYGSVVAQVAA